MLKLETKLQARNVSYLPHPEQESMHRLFVLVSSTEADSPMLTRRVWELARVGTFHIIFIGLCSDADNESATRRALVSMSSMMNFGSMISEVEVIIGKNWVDKLKSRVGPGDVVVYWDAPTASSLRNPLHQLLNANLGVPLYIVPGGSGPQAATYRWSRQIGVWIGFIAILLGSLFLQIKIYQHINNWTTILAVLSTAVEFWLIWIWHSWFQ